MFPSLRPPVLTTMLKPAHRLHRVTDISGYSASSLSFFLRCFISIIAAPEIANKPNTPPTTPPAIAPVLLVSLSSSSDELCREALSVDGGASESQPDADELTEPAVDGAEVVIVDRFQVGLLPMSDEDLVLWAPLLVLLLAPPEFVEEHSEAAGGSTS